MTIRRGGELLLDSLIMCGTENSHVLVSQEREEAGTGRGGVAEPEQMFELREGCSPRLDSCRTLNSDMLGETCEALVDAIAEC